jgi:hypothetical protein
MIYKLNKIYISRSGSQQNAGIDCKRSQEAHHENSGKMYLRTSGRTGVVLLYVRAQCAVLVPGVACGPAVTAGETTRV